MNKSKVISYIIPPVFGGFSALFLGINWKFFVLLILFGAYGVSEYIEGIKK